MAADNWPAIQDLLHTLISGVSGVGRVWKDAKWTRTASEQAATWVDATTGKIRAITIRRTGTRERFLNSRDDEVIHEVEIRLWIQALEASNRERTLNELASAVVSILRNAKNIWPTASLYAEGQPQIDAIKAHDRLKPFKGAPLCHYATIRFRPREAVARE